MCHRSILLCVVLGLAPTAVWASETASPYSGFESREIKALSAEETDALLSGHGMGLALAAELNAFPGPKHVLELASSLELEDLQLKRTQEIFDAMHREAVRLGREVIDGERELDRLFASGVTDRDLLEAAVSRIGELRAALRFAHLSAHLDMHELLNPDQVARYDALRGYEHRPVEGCPHGG